MLLTAVFPAYCCAATGTASSPCNEVGPYRQFFESQHAQLQPVLEAAGADMQAACTLPRFQLSAATVRARLLPTFPMDSPCIIPGTERVCCLSVHYSHSCQCIAWRAYRFNPVHASRLLVEPS